MKKYAVLIALVAAMLPSLTLAQGGAGSFSGPYVAVGGGYLDSRIHDQNVRTVDGVFSFDQPNTSDRKAFGQLSVGYGFDLGASMNLAVGAFYNPGSHRLDDIRATFYGDAVEQSIRSARGLYVAPGYYVTERALVFVKAGYVRATQEYDRASRAVSVNKAVDGALWGIGLKYLLGDNVFVGLELTRIKYGKNSHRADIPNAVIVSSRTEQNSTMLTVGYQF